MGVGRGVPLSVRVIIIRTFVLIMIIIHNPPKKSRANFLPSCLPPSTFYFPLSHSHELPAYNKGHAVHPPGLGRHRRLE